VTKVDGDGQSSSEEQEVRDRVDVHRVMNVNDGGSWLFAKMAGKKPANVVSSAMARQASRDKAVELTPRHSCVVSRKHPRGVAPISVASPLPSRQPSGLPQSEG